MNSLRRHEGYLMIDNRNAPPVPELMARKAGAPIVGSQLFESATTTCSHCQRIVVLNPERTRERGYCKKCDNYICDLCTTVMAQTLECVPFKKKVDEAQEAAFLAQQRGDSLIIV